MRTLGLILTALCAASAWPVLLYGQHGYNHLYDQIDTDSQHRRSFVVRGGRLLPVPEGFVLMAPTRLGPMLTTPVLSFRGLTLGR